jgi:hypothetical protein
MPLFTGGAQDGSGGAAAVPPLARASDIDLYLGDITRSVARYRAILAALSAAAKGAAAGNKPPRWLGGRAAAPAVDLDALLRERDAIKAAFIARKQAVRGLLALMAAGGGGGGGGRRDPPRSPPAASKEAALAALQADFRACDAEFKQLDLAPLRAPPAAAHAPHASSVSIAVAPGAGPLGPGAGSPPPRGGRRSRGSGGGGGVSPSAGNSSTLDAALTASAGTTARLKEGLATVNVAAAAGAEAAQTLEADREKLARIDGALDGVESELSVSRALLVRFLKRLYTDRALLAMATVVVLGLAGIIVYAAVNPDQTTFKVPDEVLPPLRPQSPPDPAPPVP